MERFHIEDLVAQDASGVVFHALDSSTGAMVALRRFFPFGVNGGGLQGDERLAYCKAVNGLTGIRHLALRSIVAGGCDSVDGMPFIATEWIEGISLRQIVGEKSLTPIEVADLLQRVLEVSEILSEVLGREGIWVETEMQSIVRGADGSGQGFTFWVSPIKWMSKNESQSGLVTLIRLTEDLMGWSGRMVADHEGRGLARWLNWLRGVSPNTRLKEVREALVALLQVAPPATVSRSPRPASKSPIVPIKKRLRIPAAVFGILVLAAAAASGWALIRWNHSKFGLGESTRLDEVLDREFLMGKSPKKNRAVKDDEVLEPVELKAREMPKMSREKAQLSKNSAVLSGKDCFTPEDHDRLVAQAGNEVYLEGGLSEIAYSKSGKTLYLQFSKQPGLGDVRGAVEESNITGDLTKAKLSPLIGSRIRLRGVVRVFAAGSSSRPVILILNRRSIEVLD